MFMQMDFLIIIQIEQVQIMSESPAVVVPQNGENQLAVLSKASESCGNTSLMELDKEVSSLGDDITTKVRKPYTITKQRERWTDEEHRKFLEALKLYGRAWRQIEEHVGTKTAVQIRSHAQKFFSKLEREGSSGSIKAPVSEIDIPPPRPKRKPAHPYPRKGNTLSSQNVSLPSQVSETGSSGCELSLHCDTAVDVMRTNKLPGPKILEMNSPHPLNCSAKKASPVSFCQKPRKRGIEEVQCDAFPNEDQEMKLSGTTCSEPELSSSPVGISAPQPETLMIHNNNMPFGIYGSKMLTTFPQMAVPYHYPMHSVADFENAAPLLNIATTNPSSLGKQNDMSALMSLLVAHTQLHGSIMPWINHNPIALAAAAAAAAATSWPSFGLQPPPPHLPLRPPSILSDRLNIESSSTVAAAMAAAAAASFADASAWLALHGTLAHPANLPEGRSLYKPNPVAHSAPVEGHQQQGLTDSSEGSKNGNHECEQMSSEEQEASTLDGMPEITDHVNHRNPVSGDHPTPSASNLQSNSHQCEKGTLKAQENPGHNSSTDCSSNEKKGKKRNGFNCNSGDFLLVDSKNGLQDLAYLTVHRRQLGKQSTEVNSSETELSRSKYQGSNSPKLPKLRKEDEEESKYNGKINDSLDALTSSALVTDCTLEEQSGSSAGKAEYRAPQCIANTLRRPIRVQIGVSLQHENGSSHSRHENMSEEVSITANQGQCISICGSIENRKGKAHDSPVLSSKVKDRAMKEHHTEDCGSEITRCEKAGKVLVQACLKRWQGGEIMFTHACTNSKSNMATSRGNSTCRAEAKENDSQQEARSSLAMGLTNGSEQSLPVIQNQILRESKACSSGSSKYIGHGFVPYRRS